MTDDFFTTLQTAPVGARRELQQTLAALRFDERGLLPVVVQCAASKQVLMMAWMNRKALAQTLQSGRMVYFSRSRQALWRKGDTSGNIQELLSLAADCDGDTLLAVVRQTGAACHTGHRHCFYLRLSAAGAEVTADQAE